GILVAPQWPHSLPLASAVAEECRLSSSNHPGAIPRSSEVGTPASSIQSPVFSPNLREAQINSPIGLVAHGFIQSLGVRSKIEAGSRNGFMRIPTSNPETRLFAGFAAKCQSALFP